MKLTAMAEPSDAAVAAEGSMLGRDAKALSATSDTVAPGHDPLPS